ncbi:MAG: aminopeptidase [Peptoniphilus sp.]|nr:aminopeptidase [Peptoniphilus sp.]MDD7363319.1 aminopeptidase [Bacillota bacterium]MDY6044048.1 aminopeptidase [Peptoniphilus sp.]
MKTMTDHKTYWERKEDIEEIMRFSESYKDFLNAARTERMAVSEIRRLAEAAGYRNFDEVDALKAGDRVYFVNREKSMILFDIGSDPEEGMSIIASHIDSPRLDLKANPLYEDEGVALLKTHYYGGVKKYQWTAIPLAIHGVMFRKDGTKVDIHIGDEPGDPIFTVTDLAPHLGKSQNKKTLAEGILGENLNILAGHRKGDEAVKEELLALIKEKYGVEEDDFVVSELEVVPAFSARDLGFDRSMIASYGQDDRVCAYSSLRALIDTAGRKRTCVAVFADKEEIGSVGNTSMSAKYFENAVGEVLAAMGNDSHLAIRRALANSYVLSADVTAALDPTYPEVMDKMNAARLGEGVCLMKYTGSRGKNGTSDANAEFLAKLRKKFADDDVIWQFGELGKVDEGGGGTVAYILAETGAEVVDLGTALFSMHAPYEVASKADIYSTYRAYTSFLTMD